MTFSVVTTADRPDLDSAALLADWPEFVLHDRQAATAMPRAWRCFPRFDVRLVLGSPVSGDTVVAGGWGVPLRWDGIFSDLPTGGYDGALSVSLDSYDAGVVPDTLCIMAAAVHPDHQRAGHAGTVLTALRSRAFDAGLSRVIAPVRPTLKSRYPLTPMTSFARWTRDDGLALDPWIRTHQRLGATILGPAPDSMIVTGNVASWSSWTGMAFPGSGRYVVPGALDLVSIDVAGDAGVYRETNVWLRHA